ncbi:MAG: DUF6531 domain-containing protein [Pseudomonadota bacterium]
MKNSPRMSRTPKALLSASAIALCMSASGAMAQDAPPPPEQDTTSPTGVSLVTGGYSTSAVDLQIGEGEFPQALVLERQYSSNLNYTHGLMDGWRGWGWSTNLSMYITVGELGGGDFPPDEPNPTNNRFPWRYGIAVGTGSVSSFVEQDPISDPIIGPNYQGPFGNWDNTRTGTLQRVGQDLIFTDVNGTRHIFEGGSRQTFLDNTPTFRTKLEAPDGTELLFHGNRGTDSVFSNRGVAILFEFDSDGISWTKACAVNLTEHYVTPTSNCPSGVPKVTYSHGPLTNGQRRLNSVTDRLGNTTTYQYTSEHQLDCIKMPGQSSCAIKNYYTNCNPIPGRPSNYSMNSEQKVYRQDIITGEQITYNFPLSQFCPLDPPGSGTGAYQSLPWYDRTMTLSDGSTRTVRAAYDGIPLKITDALGRQTNMVHGIQNFAGRPVIITKVTAPENNNWNYEYNGIGQVTKTTIKPKSGSGQQVWQTIYGGASVCNQPTAQIDANGNRTDIEYSSTHCGILKQTLPAGADGIRPQTRYTWVQKYAWTKNSSGGFTRAATPVWVMASQEFCRTTAASGSGCAGGSSDEVVTTYEYQAGSSSKGSNVFRIGMAVTSEGETLRTCYRLDELGRPISETQPKANLSTCAY